MPELNIEFDTEFEHEVQVIRAEKTIYRLTIRKAKVKELGLLGGEYLRLALVKNGKMSIFERKVTPVKTPTGHYFRVTIPRETADYLGLSDVNRTVKAYVKVLER